MNNKPSWENAPEWVNWLAQDGDFEWRWHENEPKYIKSDVGIWVWQSDGEHEVALPAPTYIGQNTLEKRPKLSRFLYSEA